MLTAGRPGGVGAIQVHVPIRWPCSRARPHPGCSELVPIRYGRMLVSPFTFYRGAALIMASDLATTDPGRDSTSRPAATPT